YPPESAANRPPGINGYSWYQRGFGTRTTTGRGYNTSEGLGRAWTWEVTNGGRRGEVGNDTSYGPYVQDKTKQTRFHKARNWKTIQDVLKKATPKIVGFFKRGYDKELGR
ncbi:unnamed protein product, partial [marine sediment metagenome]